MDYGIFSANEWVYPDSNPKNGKRNITLYTAKRSYGCAQILCLPQGNLKYEWISDTDSPLFRPEICKLIPIYVDKNTGEDLNSVVSQGTLVDYATRLAPFYVYDAMEPVEEIIEPEENGNVALYVRWSTFELNSGCYKGSLKLCDTDGDTVIIQVELNVTNATIPETETLRLTNWFSVKDISDFHGLEYMSDEHWEYIEKYGKLMRECHQTDFWIPKELIEYETVSDGEYIFDFSKFERLIKLYISLGFRYIEGPILLYRMSWQHKEFNVKINGENIPALSQKGYVFMKAFYTQLYNFLKCNGWLNIFNCHVGDEPAEHCANDYRILSGIIRKWMPGVKIIEAVEIPSLDGAIDIWVPKSVVYEKNKDAFEFKRNQGDELWYYTCMFPGGNYLNRLLDQELIRTRYLQWANYVYGFSGYLHWGLNMYNCAYGGNVFTGACADKDTHMDQILPAGDAYILYPKKDKILRSARFEMLRAGCEDFELLKLLENKDSNKASEIANKCVRSFTDYTKDIAVFEQTHRELLEQF